MVGMLFAKVAGTLRVPSALGLAFLLKNWDSGGRHTECACYLMAEFVLKHAT